MDADYAGRSFTHEGRYVYTKSSETYLRKMLNKYNLTTRKAAVTTCSNAFQSELQQLDDPLGKE